jgi:hypothetical protein
MPFKLMKKVRGLLGLACAAVLAGSALFAPRASAALIYAIDDQNNLFTFDNTTPGNIITGNFVTGLKPNEHLINIDFRPSNGVLYGIGSSFQVYTINTTLGPTFGAATAVGAGFGSVPGNSYGMDFNPAVDKIRFYSDNDNNTRIDPVTGLNIGPDTNLAYKAGDPNAGKNPSVVGAAYTNNTNPAPATTTLFGIDSNTDTLVRVGGVDGGAPEGSPNGGLLTTIGSLAVNTNNFVGFDITRNNIAFAALQPTNSSVSNLYAVDLNTGAATNQGQIIGGVRVVDIAVETGVDFTIPEPGSILSLGAVSLGMVMRRRNRA